MRKLMVPPAAAEQMGRQAHWNWRDYSTFLCETILISLWMQQLNLRYHRQKCEYYWFDVFQLLPRVDECILLGRKGTCD